MESEQNVKTAYANGPPPKRMVSEENDNEVDDDYDSGCSEEWDKDMDTEDGTPCRKRPRNTERKVPLSEEEAERRRVLANSQERERMNRLNRSLANLRRSLPAELSLSNRRLSKIRTLRLAMSYISGLSKLLADDDAARSSGNYPPQQCPPRVQPQHPYYNTPPCAPPPPPFYQPPAFATPSPHPNRSDEGYFSFCNDSQVQNIPGCSNTPTTPHTLPYPHHSMLPPGDGLGEDPPCSLVSPLTNTSSFSPCGAGPWMSSTLARGYMIPDTAPPPFIGSPSLEDGSSRVSPHHASWLRGYLSGGGESLGVSSSDTTQLPHGSFVSSPVHFLTSPYAPHHHHQGPGPVLPGQFHSTPVTHRLPGPAHGGCFVPEVSSDLEAPPQCSAWTSTSCAEDSDVL